jgi:3-oxoacyl-[acyl-carrier protein] reductase
VSDFPQGAALVVGGSGGIGSAIAEGFAEAGVPLAITYRHNEDAAGRVAEKIRNGGGTCAVHRVDLGDLDSVNDCLDAIIAEHGAIHSIAHAAGTHIDQPYISQTTPEQWRNTMDWDVNGFFHAPVRARSSS